LSEVKDLIELPTGTPPTGAPNTREVGKFALGHNKSTLQTDRTDNGRVAYRANRYL